MSTRMPRTKRALVFGNNNYQAGIKLHCCINDAQDVAEQLRSIQFEVESGFDLSYAKMADKIIRFQNSIENDDLVVFFYSGHGVEWQEENYLIPTDDQRLVENAQMCGYHAICVQKTLDSLMRKLPFTTIFLLDCCRSPLNNYRASSTRFKAMNTEESDANIPVKIRGAAGSLVAFACERKASALDSSPNRRNSLFTYHLLKHLTKPNLKIEEMMSLVCDGVYEDSDGKYVSSRIVCLRTSKIYLNATTRPMLTTPDSYPAQWETNGVTVAGGRGKGNGIHQLNYPCGLFVDQDQTVYIADCGNDRIMAWKVGATAGEVVAGGNGEGNRLDQLNRPTDVIVDRETDSLLICDARNRRVMRWPRRSSLRQGEIVINNIMCEGLTMDEQGSLYISDAEKHEVRRYDKNGDKSGTVVAGGRGQGAHFNQLNWPNHLFVDAQSTLYVSDWKNHRVMAWRRGAKEGFVVAGGNGQGTDLTRLSDPRGVWVDGSGHIYVVDEGNHRVVRWEKGAKHGTVIAGGNGGGEKANQFSVPDGLFFDRLGHLYVAENGNHRVQRFSSIIN